MAARPAASKPAASKGHSADNAAALPWRSLALSTARLTHAAVTTGQASRKST